MDLFVAIKNENSSLLKEILDSGERDVCARDCLGQIPLSYACLTRNIEAVRLLLDYGSNVNDKNIFTGNTCLMISCGCGSIWTVKMLCESGAIETINDKNDSGDTALIIASNGGHIGIVKYLCENGAAEGSAVNEKNSSGYTALMLASLRGYSDVVRLLLENGATESINEKNNYGDTALSWASKRGHNKVVKILLKYGASQ